MSTSALVTPPAPAVAGAMEAAAAFSRVIVAAPLAGRGELGDAVTALGEALAVGQAALLAVVRGLVAMEEPSRFAVGTTTARWLEGTLRIGSGVARGLVADALITDPEGGDLAQLGEALAQGAVSAAHVCTARRAVEQIPAQVRQAHAAQIDEHVTQWSRDFSPTATRVLTSHLVATVDPDAADRGFSPADLERRHLTFGTDLAGMMVGRFVLPPTVGAQFATLIHHLAAPTRALTTIVNLPGGAGQGGGDGGAGASGAAGGAGERGAEPGDPAEPDPARFVATLVDPSTGELLDAALAGTDQSPHPGQLDRLGRDAVAERRSPAQRRADALAAVIVLAGVGLDTPTSLGSKPSAPRVVVHMTPEQMDGSRSATNAEGECSIGAARDPSAGAAMSPEADPGADSATLLPDVGDWLAVPYCDAIGPMGPSLTRRMTCDPVIERVLTRRGRVLSLSSVGRLVTPPQRRALVARDGGCTFPGCSAPPALCDAHHVIFWSDGGPTELDNLALLCGRHHDLIHLGEWTAVMECGVPWFIPPSYLDPSRPRIRNHLRHNIARAQLLGMRIRQ